LPRLNPYLGKRPDALKDNKTIKDARTGHEDTFYLVYLDEPLAGIAGDLMQELTMQYMGVPAKGISPTAPPPEVDGLPIPMSHNLLATAATIYTMQEYVTTPQGIKNRPDGAQIYAPEEFMCFSVTDESLWQQLKDFADKINEKGEQRKNGIRAAGKECETPSDTPGSILKLQSEPIPSSVPLTNGSEDSANDFIQKVLAAT
jgi:hypothetical protein